MGGEGAIVSGSVSGQYAAPAGLGGVQDTSKYVTVPLPGDSDHAGSYRATNLGLVGEVFNYFGLWWGSIDAYNTFTFYLNNQETESFTGAQVIALGATFGDQLSLGSNRYVNFLNLQPFDSFEISVRSSRSRLTI